MAHDQFNIRISPAFRSQLEAVAASTGESQNACLHRLVAEAASAVGWREAQPEPAVVAAPLRQAPSSSGQRFRLIPRRVQR